MQMRRLKSLLRTLRCLFGNKTVQKMNKLSELILLAILKQYNI